MTSSQTQCDFPNSAATAGAVASLILILPENVLGGPSEKATSEKISLARIGLRAEDRHTHNRTTRNGFGGDDTADEDQIFCGYGDGDWLTLQLTQPCALVLTKTVIQNLPLR